MRKLLNVGIIGLGVGEAHIEGYQAHPACQVTAICDFDESKLAEVSGRYSGIAVSKDADEVLLDPNIDVVSIATWENYHHEQILTGISTNKHLFVEKPICQTEDQAIEISVKLKDNPSLKISSNLILRKSERFIKLKEEIQLGVYGVISNIKGSYNYGRLSKITEGWRGELEYYSGVCGGGVHIIDLMQWITDDRIISVGAFGNNIQSAHSNFKFNDLVVSALQFEKGHSGLFTSDLGCVHPHFHQLEIYGTERTFINGLNEATIYCERDSQDYSKDESSYPGVHKGDLLYNFIQSIIDDTEPEVSQKEIFDALAVCFAIDKSVETQQIEDVNFVW